MQLGTRNFSAYNRNLRRVMWAEFLDAQLRIARAHQFRALIVANPLDDTASLTAVYTQIRQSEDRG